MNQEISRINEVLPDLSSFEKAGEMRDWIRRVLRRIEHYKAEPHNLLKRRPWSWYYLNRLFLEDQTPPG